MKSHNEIVKKYIKYKHKYRDIKQKYNRNGKYFVDINDEVDIIYKNKSLLYSLKSKYQKIEVFSHSIFGNILVIDDDLQLTEQDERTYHEMIVHVPMNYLENAKTVLIIGGGDCGTLTEVCKHPNVEEIIMIEIDKEVIETAKKYFKDLTTGLNDKRTKLIIADGYKWLKKNLVTYENYFDVIIVDSTDYTTALSLFTDDFYKKISVVLKKFGIFGFNCMSLSWIEVPVQEIFEQMGDFFKYVNLYQAFIPTYASGHYAFCICSHTIDPRNTPINFNSFNQKGISCKYYNPDVHLSSFYLPNKYEDQSKKERLGTTIVIDVKKVDFNLLNDINFIKNLLDKICIKYNLNVVGKTEKVFTPQGLTVTYLLSESHLAIHTWPEKGKCSIDLFTCGEFKWYIKDSYDLTNILIDDLKISEKDIKVKSVEREI